MVAAKAGESVRTTDGRHVGIGRSEDETQDNCELVVWSERNSKDRIVVRFSPSHARNLAAQLVGSADALDDDYPSRERR